MNFKNFICCWIAILFFPFFFGCAINNKICPNDGKIINVPDKTVILTFDDSVRSHLTIVAPILKKYGFGATFFVTHAWMDDSNNYLNWKEIAKLDEMGFEVGNHSWSHIAFSTKNNVKLLSNELVNIENELAKVGVRKPVSFSWPGNQFCPEAVEILKNAGYLFARRGPQPDVPKSSVVGLGPLYNPKINNPLLVPSSGLAIPEWTLSDFKTIVDRAKDGKIVVFQFHGVPDHRHPSCTTPPERFEEFVKYLSDNNFNVISLRDARKYVLQDAGKNDPLSSARFIP